MSSAIDLRTYAHLRHAAGVAIGLPMFLLSASAPGLRRALARVRWATGDPARLTALTGYEREVAAALAVRIGEQEMATSIGASAATLGWLDLSAAAGAHFARMRGPQQITATPHRAAAHR